MVNANLKFCKANINKRGYDTGKDGRVVNKKYYNLRFKICFK